MGARSKSICSSVRVCFASRRVSSAAWSASYPPRMMAGRSRSPPPSEVRVLDPVAKLAEANFPSSSSSLSRNPRIAPVNLRHGMFHGAMSVGHGLQQLGGLVHVLLQARLHRRNSVVEPLQRLLQRACDLDLVLVEGLLQESEGQRPVSVVVIGFPAFAESLGAALGLPRRYCRMVARCCRHGEVCTLSELQIARDLDPDGVPRPAVYLRRVVWWVSSTCRHADPPEQEV